MKNLFKKMFRENPDVNYDIVVSDIEKQILKIGKPEKKKSANVFKWLI